MPGERQQANEPPAGGTTIWLVQPADPRVGGVMAFWERADAQRQAAGGDPTRSAITETVVHGDRRRCVLCGEPVVLDDPSEEESWRHADDANDLGDHTAEVRA